MVSSQPHAVIRVARIGLVSDYRKAERAKADGEGKNPPNSKKKTYRCLTWDLAHTRVPSSNKRTIEKARIYRGNRKLIQSIVASMLLS